MGVFARPLPAPRQCSANRRLARVTRCRACGLSSRAYSQSRRVLVGDPRVVCLVQLLIFWTIHSPATLEKLRAYFQEFMIVALIWEFADTPAQLLELLRAFVAGSWVLAALTLAAYRSPETIVAGQIRFAAYGQDPNEVARYIDLAFPIAALLFRCERRRLFRNFALAFIPAGLQPFCSQLHGWIHCCNRCSRRGCLAPGSRARPPYCCCNLCGTCSHRIALGFHSQRNHRSPGHHP